MRKNNRWTLGARNFVLPDLPEDQKGRHGCRFHSTTFDPAVGEEVFVLFMEEPDFVDQYSQIAPFNLLAQSGLVRTPHGVVAFIVWQIAAGTPSEIMVEHFLNPQKIETLRLVSSVAKQTHLKLVIINNETGEVGGFIDFDNVFGFNELASAMAIAIGHEPEGDFGSAMQHVMNTMTVQDLLELLALRVNAES